MTEPRAPRRPRRPGLLAVGAWSLAAFVVVLALLVVQMRVGRDPALGARPAAALAPAPRRVLVRRVIVKRVVVDEVHDAEERARAPRSARWSWSRRAQRPPPRPRRSGPCAGSRARPRPAGDQDVMTDHELTFRCMGTDVRLVAPDRAGLDDARAWLASFDARLSRFRDDSELCALNRDRRSTVPASALLRTAVSAGLWAAQRTEGLVDPTVLPALRAAGYAASLAGVAPAGLADALAVAPARRVARPHPAARWRRVYVDDAHGTVRRPPGIELDTGGTGKGLAADALAHRLRGTGALRGGLRRRPPRRRRGRAADAL